MHQDPVGGATTGLPCRLTGIAARVAGAGVLDATDTGTEAAGGAVVPLTASMAAWSNRKGSSTCTDLWGEVRGVVREE